MFDLVEKKHVNISRIPTGWYGKAMGSEVLVTNTLLSVWRMCPTIKVLIVLPTLLSAAWVPIPEKKMCSVTEI